MITNIQLLRALAALGVVLYHTNFRLWGDIHTEFQGVSLFFVISGFIITFVSQKKNENFLLHRFIRIAPVYWLVTFIFIVLLFLGSQHTRLYLTVLTGLLLLIYQYPKQEGKFIKYLRNGIYIAISFFVLKCFRPSNLHAYYENYFSFTAFAKSLLFLPGRDVNNDIHPIMGIGWTLNIEVFFYVVFGLWMFISRRLAPLLTCLVLIGLHVYNNLIGCENDFCILYSHDYTYYFIFGVALYYIHEIITHYKVKIRKDFALIFAAFSAVILICANTVFTLFPTSYEWHMLYAGPFLAVLSAILCHKADLRMKGGFWLLLGNASYSLYLIHSMVLETMRPFLQRTGLPSFSDNIFSLLVTIAMSIFVAIVFYKKIEYPLLQFLRKHIDRKKTA